MASIGTPLFRLVRLAIVLGAKRDRQIYCHLHSLNNAGIGAYRIQPPSIAPRYMAYC
eukprot:jgi/Mesvir1/5902/Mv25187-RA.1